MKCFCRQVGYIDQVDGALEGAERHVNAKTEPDRGEAPGVACRRDARPRPGEQPPTNNSEVS